MVQRLYFKGWMYNLLILILLALGLIIFLPGDSTTYANEQQDNQIPEMTISEQKPQKENVSINFVGDMQFTGDVNQAIKENGIDYPFRNVKSILSAADITIGNLETTLTTRGIAQNKQFIFRSNPIMAKAMVNTGFDCLALANNHSLDYGKVSLIDTITYLKKNSLAYLGGGRSLAEATRIYYTVNKGVKIAILNYSRVLPNTNWKATNKGPGLASAYENEPIYSKVKEARKNADVVIVYLHWGKERVTNPEKYQVKIGHKLIDFGADIVVGNHPHIIQPFEWYKGKFIAYSLGNFIFNKSRLDRSNQSVILKVNTNGQNINPNIIGVRIYRGQVKVMSSKEKKEFYYFIDKISSKAMINESGLIGSVIK